MVVASSESTTYGDGPGQDPGGQWYRNLSIVGGPHGVARPFTKWSNEAAGVHTLPSMVTRAAELAWRAPAGPVYLNVPLEILLEEWDGREAKPVVPPGSTHSSPEEADLVAELIREAAVPVVVTETAGREAGGFEALVAFAEAWNLPVVEPDSAVCGNFPRTHPLHAGSDIGPWMDEADLILLVNCRAPSIRRRAARPRRGSSSSTRFRNARTSPTKSSSPTAIWKETSPIPCASSPSGRTHGRRTPRPRPPSPRAARSTRSGTRTNRPPSRPPR